ncbi:MAG: hypothetical protein GWO16_07385, partial [Gammaproteobacteria bacterium]|nr:hypothetical protein [Gammaproteobacteria bacterium]
MALRRHYRLPPGTLPAHVGVGLFAPHDVYLTPVGADELLATCMTDRAGCRAVRDDYDGFLRRSPYGDLFANATPAGAVLAWHHPLFVPRAYHTGGMLLVGDAGGGVDPCLGVGLSMALASALFAAEAVPGMLAEPPRRAAWLHHFDRRRKLLFRHFDLFGRLFCLAVRSPRGSEALLWGMRHWPGIAAQLLDIVAAGRPWRGFAWSALLEPLVGGLSGGAPPPEGVLELGAPDPAESGELMGRQ